MGVYSDVRFQLVLFRSGQGLPLLCEKIGLHEGSTMNFAMRTVLIVAMVLGSVSAAGAEEGDAGQNKAKLEEARRAISSMRESYAYVMRKEEQAKSDHDPVLLNALHQISNRIADLVSVADHALDDMRVAISSNEPSEAIDAELEKIMLAKTKVEAARNEADRSAGLKLVNGGDGAEGTSRNFLNESENLTGENTTTDPVTGLSTDSSTVPGNSGSNPPAASKSTTTSG